MRFRRNSIITYTPLLSLLAADFACAMALVATFLIIIGIPGPHFFTFLSHLLSEAILLTLPAILFWPKGKYLTPVILAIAAIVFFANILYFRNFSDLITFSTLRLCTTVDSIILRSALASIKWYDFILFIPPAIAATAAHIAFDKAGHTGISGKTKISLLIISVLIISLSQYKHFRDFRNYSISRGHLPKNAPFSEKISLFFRNNVSFYSDITRHGIFGAYLIDAWHAYDAITRTVTMSDEDIDAITTWHDSECRPSGSPSDKHKNLILIIVESLNTTAFEWSFNNRKAMPNLNRFISDSTSITFTSVYPQAGNGRSSDGQMMYNCGLYPSPSDPMCAISPEGPYPSLPRMLRDTYHSIEIIPENPRLWNHSLTNKAFGFKEFRHTQADDDPVVEADSILLCKSYDIIAGIQQPFVAVIPTLSMHDPYVQTPPATTWISHTPGIADTDRNYLEACAAFDRVLGTFVDRMRQTPAWDNTIVVIASDHEARKMCLSPAMSDDRLIFTILNSGLSGFINDDTVGQIDVFPTIVDAMGLWDSVKWHGFGSSLLREIPGFALRHDGSIAGNPMSDTADINRQRRAASLSYRWIIADNKRDILDSLGIDNTIMPASATDN